MSEISLPFVDEVFGELARIEKEKFVELMMRLRFVSKEDKDLPKQLLHHIFNAHSIFIDDLKNENLEEEKCATSKDSKKK